MNQKGQQPVPNQRPLWCWPFSGLTASTAGPRYAIAAILHLSTRYGIEYHSTYSNEAP